jgi:hypothetical protein
VIEPPPEPPTSPGPPPLGDKSAGILLGMFQDFYRQELNAEEDVFRTLPFFATALGLIIAALNYSASQLPEWTTLTQSCGSPSRNILSTAKWAACGWPALLAGVLLALATFSCVGVLWFLASATKRRKYERVGPEGAHLARAQALHEYHHARGLTDTSLDNAVVGDLREQLLDDYTEVVPLNRNLNLQRYRSRARAVSFLIWSLFIAVAATILVGVTTKFGLMVKVKT